MITWAPPIIRVPLARRHVGWLIGSIAPLNIMVLLGAYLRQSLGPTGLADADWKVLYLVNQISLAGENNFAVWYSSLLLLSVALAAAACFVLDRHHGTTRIERLLSYAWCVIAVLFVVLSLDEAGSLHERLSSFAGMLGPIALEGYSSWIGLLIMPIAAVGLFFVTFAMLRLRETPAALALVILGTLLFLSVPAQEELEIAAQGGDPEWARPPIMMILEEGAELFGAFAFLAAFADYASWRYNTQNGRHAEFEPGLSSTLIIVMLLAIGLLTAWFTSPWYIPEAADRGIPLNWFPGVLTFLTSLAVFYLWRQSHQRATSFWQASPFLLLALFSLFLSFDHGAAQSFTERLSAERNAHRLVLDVGLTGVIFLIGISIGMQSISRAGRLLIAAWAVVSVAALLAGGKWNPLLSFAAYALLFPGVLGGLLSTPVLDPIRSRDHRGPELPR